MPSRLSSKRFLITPTLCATFVLASCGGGGGTTTSPPPPPTGDTTAPTVTFSTNTLTVQSGGTSAITLTATDNIAVTSGPTVTCTNGGSFANNTFTGPSVTVDTTSVCTATASDAAGNTGSSTLTVTVPSWTSAQFENEGLFKNKCDIIRTGTNPATGNPYADTQATLQHELQWLRSWSDNTYLWYNEIEDKNPNTFTDKLVYFKQLKTTATTSSGTDKDQFHFSMTTEEYQERVSSGSSAGYGIRWAFIQSSPPRDIRIAYTEANAPATTAPANLARGAVILEVDGVDAINGGTQANVDVLNGALFPSAENEQHTFKVRDLDGTERTFSMTSATVTSNPVNTSKTITVGTDKIGYVLFNTFGTRSAEEQLVDAFATLATQNITELVLDLRYNGGGFLDISSELAYMIAGAAPTTGKKYDDVIFNDKHTVTNPVTGRALAATPFHSTTQGFTLVSGQALPALNLSKVYVLSTSRTCSASEALINGLRGVNVEVVLIGSTTCGKPYGFYTTDNCGETYFSIQFRGENEKGFGDYADGFVPVTTAPSNQAEVAGCLIEDDYTALLGDQSEKMFAAALNHISTGNCPTAVTPQEVREDKFFRDPAAALMQTPRLKRLQMLEQSNILTAPEALVQKD
ncbi:MAG: peptidase [Robiginitomaculum sp.]|nr:MAG: peptidase [Robiginitomaculum sp.]